MDIPAEVTRAQLRYEGIDALEKNAIQPHTRNARDINLHPSAPKGPTTPVGACGYILPRQGDKESGRPICFVYASETDEDDGREFFLQPPRVRESTNYQLIEAWTVYPLFYETVFKELRDELLVALAVARANSSNEYITLDQSLAGVVYAGLHSLSHLPPIFPKLFPRLDDWNGQTLQGFLAWSDRNDNECVHTLSDDQFIGFHDAFEVSGNTVRLLYALEHTTFPKHKTA